MTFYRPESLRSILVCLVVGLVGSAMQGGQQSSAQQQQPPPPAQQKPAQQQPAQQQSPPPQQPRRPNPFETVPSAPAQPAPEQPKLQQPANRPAAEVRPTQPGAAPPQDIIEDITFRGSRRVPQDTLRALIYTRKGDHYDEERLRRDFVALWN